MSEQAQKKHKKTQKKNTHTTHHLFIMQSSKISTKILHPSSGPAGCDRLISGPMGAAVERVAFPVPPKSRFEDALKKRSDARPWAKKNSDMGKDMGKNMNKHGEI